MSNLKNRIGIALIISILLSILIVLFSKDAATSALLRGDFPGFYVLAKIIADGKATDLYNLNLQQQIQNQAWPELAGNFLISVYPPSLALILTPLALFSPLNAQLIFSTLSILCLYFSFTLLRDRIEFLKDSPWLLFALLVTNPFLLVGTIGGQNTAFSIAILSLASVLLEKSQKNNSKAFGILAGFVFSFWLFKPQFGIFVLPGLLFFRLRLPLFGYSIGALFHYVTGALLLGALWPIEWLGKITEFAALNYGANSVNQASIIGSINVALRERSVGLTEAPLLTCFGVFIFTIIVLTILTRAARKTRPQPSICFFWAYLAAIPLISPQTLFYDIGIIFFAALNCLRNQMTQQSQMQTLSILVALQAVAIFSQLTRYSLSFPIFGALACCYYISLMYPALNTRKPRV